MATLCMLRSVYVLDEIRPCHSASLAGIDLVFVFVFSRLSLTGCFGLFPEHDLPRQINWTAHTIESPDLVYEQYHHAGTLCPTPRLVNRCSFSVHGLSSAEQYSDLLYTTPYACAYNRS